MKGKRETIRNLISIQERVNKLFEDVLVDIEATGPGQAVSWSPRVDIYETEDEFVVNAELPGVIEKNLDIKVEGNALVIKGYRPHLHGLSSEDIEGKHHMVECTSGTFKRSFLLPESVDSGKITAILKDGILKIVLAKKSSDIVKKNIRID
ncbi:MAG TPA: Hsp20/alpha crystallin family protein [Nitrospirae bacterium]|nr:Hsp20/alpha crystallin family protein [Nitrospirota bacterium]